MGAILKYDFQKRKQLYFTEAKYLNYTKSTILHNYNYISRISKGIGLQEHTVDPFGFA